MGGKAAIFIPLESKPDFAHIVKSVPKFLPENFSLPVSPKSVQYNWKSTKGGEDRSCRSFLEKG
jgi:hypothetical protein